MDLSQLYWRESSALLLMLLPLLFLALNRRLQKRALLCFADASLLPWIKISAMGKPSRFPIISLWLSWTCLSIALAGPRTVLQLPPDYQPQPATVMVVMDLSASMNARDLPPSRRGYAQQLLAALLSDRSQALAVGIVVFSGHAFMLLPATTDHVIWQHFIDSLNDISLPTAGNAMVDGIELAVQALDKLSGDRYILVLTDGDIETAEQVKVRESFSAQPEDHSIQTLIIGIGDTRPVSVAGNDGALLQFEGRAVLSRLEAHWLKQLAGADRIHYRHYAELLKPSMKDLPGLSVQRADNALQQRIHWQEWFFIPLLCGILLLLVSVQMAARKKCDSGATLYSTVALALLVLILLSPLFMAPPAFAQESSFSLQPLTGANTLTTRFARATACYRAQDYLCAQQEFAAAAWLASDKKQRAVAVFNLANSYFQLGDYDQAAVLYRDAGLLGVDSDLVAINLDYAESMQLSIQRQIDQLRQNFARAQWKAAVNGDRVPTLNDFLSNDENLIVTDSAGTSGENFYRAPAALIKHQVLSAFGFSETGNLAATRWIETERVLPRTTAGMLNRLFEMELDIPHRSGQPLRVEGKRKW